MSRGQTLRALVTERLTAAAEDIFKLVEKTIEEYEEEDQRKQRLLDQLLKPTVRLSRTEERVQADPETAAVKEEEEELSVKHEELLLPVSVPPTIPEFISVGTTTAELSTVEPRETKPEEETQGEMISSKPQIQTGTETEHSSDTDEDLRSDRDHYQVQTKDKRPKLSPGNRRTPAKNKKHKCYVCGKTFEKKRDLVRHIRVHTGEKPYSCLVCDKSFSQKGNLQTHVKRYHTQDDSKDEAEKHQCKICKRTFVTKYNLQEHMSVVHTGERPFSCTDCGLAFARKSTLNDHKGIHKEDYRCTICDKTLATKGALLRHGKVHTGERPFSCSVCDKTFTQSSHLRRHETRTHTGEGKNQQNKLKKYQCGVCKKKYWSKQDLESHSKVHTGEKPYSCSTCDKSFSHERNLKVHMRMHTGQKPYSCPTCKKTFSQRQHLKSHIRTHTGEKPYSCSTCNKGFIRKKNLEKHRQTHAGGSLTVVQSVQNCLPKDQGNSGQRD